MLKNAQPFLQGVEKKVKIACSNARSARAPFSIGRRNYHHHPSYFSKLFPSAPIIDSLSSKIIKKKYDKEYDFRETGEKPRHQRQLWFKYVYIGEVECHDP